MQKKKISLRCYAKRDGDIWVAVCIDLSLAAQARSLNEAQSKLDAQILDYVTEAVAGQHRAHCDYLLNRRSPVSDIATFYAIRALNQVQVVAKNILHASVGTSAIKAYRKPAPLPLAC